MAGETLRTLAQMLADFPDNTQRLISPLNARDMIITEAINVGYLVQDNGSFTVNVQAGVWVPVNDAVTAPAFEGNYWRSDGNNRFVPSYVDQGITVNPGTTRLTSTRVSMLVSKGTGVAQTYNFGFFQATTQIRTSYTVEIPATPIPIQFSADFLQDMSDLTPIYLAVQGVGTSDDLTFDEFVMRANGAPI